MALAATDGTDYFSVGTCTVIGPHIALTAQHVIDDFKKKFRESNKVSISNDTELSFSIIATHAINGGEDGALWTITKVFPTPSDIAILFLSPCSEHAANFKWKKPQIVSYPPKVGSRIVGFGYGGLKTNKKISKIVWNVDARSTVGEVREIHHSLRDSARLNFPCFRTNARFDGGMSGGPVFDENGHLCGLICSDLPPIEEHEEHASYVSMIWPIMITMMDLKFDKLDELDEYPVLELAKKGIIRLKDWEKIELIRVSDEAWYSQIILENEIMI